MEILRSLKDGHNQCTTCVETTNQDQCVIITGAERGEICLWSADDGTLLKNLKLKKRDDISGIACSKLRPEKFFVSAYRQVFTFDMRQLNKPLQRVAIAGDCINQIVLDESETKLALALDSGEVEIFDLQKKTFSHVLEEHTNICNTVSFQNTNKLFSGGMDNLLIEWNIEEEKVMNKIDMVELSAYSEDLGPLPFYVVSPPFIHSLSVSRSGRHVACGTENAMVYLFDAVSDDLKCIQSFRKHNKGVSQVHFPKFSDGILLSAGNDFKFCAWKIPDTEAQPTFDEDQTKVKSRITTPLFEITRPEKANWIATGSNGAQGFVAVVDSTTTPTTYSFPN